MKSADRYYKTNSADRFYNTKSTVTEEVAAPKNVSSGAIGAIFGNV